MCYLALMLSKLNSSHFNKYGDVLLSHVERNYASVRRLDCPGSG
jgi:hypothetical protein